MEKIRPGITMDTQESIRDGRARGIPGTGIPVEQIKKEGIP